MYGIHLSELLDAAALRRPDHSAVEDERGRSLTFAELLRNADRLATRLMRWGVGRGDRVGLWLPKSIEAVTSIHGILRTGASYVPVDPTGPPQRAAGILAASGVKAVVVAADLMPAVYEAHAGAGPRPRLIVVDDDALADAGHGLETSDPLPSAVAAGDARWCEVIDDDAPSPLLPQRTADDLAYILFTSGSTGQPKGVMLSHLNAFTFLDWCQRTLGPWNDDDRFASHAPFHFDLSVFDVFAACQAASTLVLIGENLGKDPVRLSAFITERRLNIWYSAPSILALLAERGKLEWPGSRAPRLVLFAGEVFPLAGLARLRSLWPRAVMWNLYGPTETNVCTAYPIPERIPEDRTEPYPIGTVCAPYALGSSTNAGMT